MGDIERRFRAALPHELDGPGPTKADMPAYIERVEELSGQLAGVVDALEEAKALIETAERDGYVSAGWREDARMWASSLD